MACRRRPRFAARRRRANIDAMADPVLDFWFDFASTYSYLAAARIRPLAAEAKVQVRFRPFLLGPIFKAQGWDTSPFNLYEAKGRYMWRDMERLAAEPRCRSAAPTRFRRTACCRRASPWSDWRKAGAKTFPSRSTTRSSSRTAGSTIRRTLAEILSRTECRRRGRARSGAIGRHQVAPAVGGRGGAAARRVRRAELHDRRRRTVLG